MTVHHLGHMRHLKEGIAGAGGGELGIAGSLSLVFSYDQQQAKIGENVQITASRKCGHYVNRHKQDCEPRMGNCCCFGCYL